MTTPGNSLSPCRLVAEFVDEAELPPAAEIHSGEVVRPRMVGDFSDVGEPADGFKEFTVLLKDGRVVAVRGHALKYTPHPTAGQDLYAIVARDGGVEQFVALFKSADVAGVFHGEIRADRKTA
jgi:hypothetical protein